MISDPFVDQMLAAPAFVAFVIVKVWRPLLADVAVLLIAGVLLVVIGFLIDRGSARITAWRAAHALRRDVDEALDEIAALYDPFPADSPTQQLPDVVRLAPQPRKLQRRRVAGVRMPRIPGRRIVRRHTTFSDRRH